MHILITEENKASLDDGFVKKYHTKVYTKLMPLLIIVYIISFIDSTNIGMEKAAMSIDLGLSARAYDLGAGVLLAFYIYVVFSDKPNKAKWLVKKEFDYIEITLEQEFPIGLDREQKFSFKYAFCNKVFMLVIVMYFTYQIGVYSLIYFLLSIFSNYVKMSTFTLGLLSAIPSIAVVFGGFFLPRYVKTARKSQIILLIGFMSMAIGFFIGAIGGPVLGMIGFCVDASMFFVVQSIVFTFPVALMSGNMLVGGLAFMACLGICGGFVGSYVFCILEDQIGSPSFSLWFAIILFIIAKVTSLIAKQPKMQGEKVNNRNENILEQYSMTS